MGIQEKKRQYLLAPRFIRVILVVLTGVLLMGMGERYGKQGHTLGGKVYQALIQQGYCVDIDDCHKKAVMFGEDGNRVNLNLYGVEDRKVLSAVFAMVLTEGLEITGGVPITISVFPKPKKEYLGAKSFFQKPSIRMEVNEK